MGVINFIQENDFLLLLFFYALEKFVKKSKWPWDDILFDMFIDPIRGTFKKKLPKQNN